MSILKQYVNRLLQYIDSGRFFRSTMKVLYILLGACAFIPAAMIIISLFKEETRGVLSFMNYALEGWSKFIVYLALFLIFVYFVFLGFCGFFYWMCRQKDLYRTVRIGDKIKALPTIAHIIRCLGESYGLLSFFVPLGAYIIFYVLLIFAGFKPLGVYEVGDFFKLFFLGLLGIPVVAIVLFLNSYLVILISHGISELILIKTSIANNVSDIGDIHRATLIQEVEPAEDLATDKEEGSDLEPLAPTAEETPSDTLGNPNEQ